MVSSGQQDPEVGKDGVVSHSTFADIVFYDAVDFTELPADELEAALHEIAPDAPAEDISARTARLESDRRIVQACARENFDGPMTKKLLLNAYAYATPVIGHLLSTSKIFPAAGRLRRPVRRQDEDVLWTIEERKFLTERTVDLGIFGVFHEHGLKNRRWDHRRGATLTTYAANGCIMCFREVYQKWWRGKVLERSVGDLALEVPLRLQIDQHCADPADQIADRLEAAQLLRQFPPQEREALVLRALHGATQAEAAAQVGLSPKALESRLGRTRTKLGLNRGDPPTEHLTPNPTSN